VDVLLSDDIADYGQPGIQLVRIQKLTHADTGLASSGKNVERHAH